MEATRERKNERSFDMTTNMNQNATPPHTNEKDRVRIFDTTLRDGEQSPGAAMTLEEKLEVADLLDEMGVDIIEAGFPIASNGDFEAVSANHRRVKHMVASCFYPRSCM